MQRFIFYILLFSLCFAASAEIPNPAFGEKKHQVSVHFGYSMRDGGKTVEKLFLGSAAYSQANKFFMLPGRISFEVLTNQGIGNLSQYNQDVTIGFVQDLILPIFWWANPKPISRTYLGINLGIYIQPNTNNRIGSRFTFGEKGFLGYRITDIFALELFGRHFSNGTLTEKNSGQNFFGLSAVWNFSAKGN